MKKTTMPATPTEFENLGPVLGQAPLGQSPETTDSSASAPNDAAYIGKQQELYLYSRLGWRNYLAHQAAFGAFSGYYTVQLGEDQLIFIAQTEALPDQEARAVEPLDAKDDLFDLNARVLDMFLDGKIYIERTYTDPTKQATMLKAAGYNYYTKAGDRNWSSTESLISAFTLFLTNYGAELLASGWMPEGFPDAFGATSKPFLMRWQSYKDKWAVARQERSQKAENNNLIYKILSEMCEVGRRKFANNPEIKKKFTITALLDEVAGHSPSGLEGFCAINGNKRYPVAGVRLSAVVGTEERFAISDAKGRYFLQLPSGDYTVKMEAEGYVPQTFQKKVKIGVKSRMNVTMERVPAPVIPTVSAQQPAIAPAQSVNLTDMVEGVIKQAGNGVH